MTMEEETSIVNDDSKPAILHNNIIQMQEEHYRLRDWFFKEIDDYVNDQNYFPLEMEVNKEIF